ncbi:hypothetical protein J1N09_02835 [Aureitalea sp. L0-47]|uniref:hypothetical protein n=1 Tax=Aureitalea sp. L0-47 TaxID=2816962 RepID=UPI0022384155|nr:hypothetical protein [Aureitalea sp. L0-47]MCW5518758.1 hypothetical protein [Aureitalea sp. L0-47]
MKNLRILFLICCTITVFGITNAQSSEVEIQNIIDRFNTEVPAEPGCNYREYLLEDCIFSVTLECKGNEFKMSFNLNDIERMYKDKADMEDNFDTLFFVCNNGNNCISSNSDMIPPSPIFPIRLPNYKYSTLGDDAIEVLSSILGNCN